VPDDKTLEPSQGTSTVTSPFLFQPEEGDRSSLRSNVYFEPEVNGQFPQYGPRVLQYTSVRILYS